MGNGTFNFSHAARGFLLPVMGIGLFLSMFRYTSFLMGLYPVDCEIRLLAIDVQSYTVFLIPLTAYSVATLLSRGRVSDFILTSRTGGIALALVGSVGALFAASTAYDPNPATVWLSSILLAAGYLAVYVMWTSYLANDFTANKLVVLFCGHLISLLIARYSDVGFPASSFAIALVPLASGAAWLLSRNFNVEPDAPTSDRRQGFLVRSPSVWLFIAFLLTGSVVRGLVNEIGALPSNSYAYSIVVAVVLAGGCIGLSCGRRLRSASHGPENESRDLSRFIVVCWGAITALFIVGMFLFVVLNEQELGGRIITFSRSALDVVYLAFLCNLFNGSPSSTVPLFILYDLLVDIASWALSYMVLPIGLSSLSGPEEISSRSLVTLVVFVLVAATTSICGIGMSISERNQERPSPSDDHGTSKSDEVSTDDLVRKLLVDRHGLTVREATVALLYARGYSLGKVADEVGITLSTARTHIKHAYRKLGVHSKDELIETIASHCD